MPKQKDKNYRKKIASFYLSTISRKVMEILQDQFVEEILLTLLINYSVVKLLEPFSEKINNLKHSTNKKDIEQLIFLKNDLLLNLKEFEKILYK